MDRASIERFLKNRDLILSVDALAQRYGVMPYEILASQSVHEFNFNFAVLLIAKLEEKKHQKTVLKDGTEVSNDISGLGASFKRTVKKE
jgi:hypothetical protein